MLTLSVLFLAGCTNFVCGHCKSAADHRREREACQAIPRIKSAPQRTGALEVDYVGIELQHTGSGQFRLVTDGQANLSGGQLPAV